MATVLVTDDSVFTVESLEKILVKAGHTVVAKAHDGSEAYEKYASFKPDLVTMDITMPDTDGLMAVRRIIKDFPEAKIIMISARGRDNELFEALEMGALHYIFKPFLPDEIIQVVNKVLNNP